MANFNIYYFVVKPLRINAAEGSTGASLQAPGPDSAVVQSIFDGFRTKLTELVNQAKNHIPHLPSRNLNINVVQIPAQADNPTSPDFSSVHIEMHEPIVYFTTRIHDSHPSSSVDRRPEFVLMDALRQVRCQEFPNSWVNEQQRVLNSSGELSGLSVPGIAGVSFPVTACVFSDARQNFGASNWQQLMSNNLACAAFHEIAHCKAETDNRSHNSRWENAISESIHSVSNVSVLASNGVGREPSTADYQLMGEHMLCPINFYKLDQSIDNQCFSEGEIVTLTPRS